VAGKSAQLKAAQPEEGVPWELLIKTNSIMALTLGAEQELISGYQVHETDTGSIRCSKYYVIGRISSISITIKRSFLRQLKLGQQKLCHCHYNRK